MNESDLEIAGAMDSIAIEMEKVALALLKYSDQKDREEWKAHASEMLGAAKIAQGWAEALYRIAEGCNE